MLFGSGGHSNVGQNLEPIRIDGVPGGRYYASGEPIWTENLIENLTRRFLRKIVFLPEPALPVINEVYDSIRWPGYD